jgi:hypothetical protein
VPRPLHFDFTTEVGSPSPWFLPSWRKPYLGRCIRGRDGFLLVARIRGIGVVYDAILERERAHARPVYAGAKAKRTSAQSIMRHSAKNIDRLGGI